jgi:cytochrome c oxidase subunit 1
MASGFMNAYWLFQFNNDFVYLLSPGPANSGWTIYPPLSAFQQLVVLVWV